MIVDANLLLYAVDASSPHHDVAREWWEASLNGRARVGLPWQTIGAFVRISTHPRVMDRPLGGAEAWSFVAEWLDVAAVWVPAATARTAAILGDLLTTEGISGDLVPDAQLAALALEHGVPVASTDGDFARFDAVRWIDPVRGRA